MSPMLETLRRHKDSVTRTQSFTVGLAVVFVLFGALMWPAMSDSYAVEEWEHGFKTSRVIATRYKNPTFGYNIGFEFPRDINNADRAEVGEFFRTHDGWIFQGGGYPGAVAYVKFKDVEDREGANKKLREILPALSQFMADLH